MEIKKITIDARMINSSGIGRYLQSILPPLISHFKYVILLGNKSEIEESLKLSNLDVIEFRAPIYSLKEQIEYSKIIPPCDIFFSPHYNIPLLPIKAKKRIVTIHDVFHLAFYNTLTLSQKIYSKIVINKALKKSDAIITVSNFSKQEIIKYTSNKYSNKIGVIHNGVDIGEIHRSIHSNCLDINSYFLFVGNVKPHKNLKRAVEAYKLFIDSCKEQKEIPHLIIVGKKEGFITGDGNIIEYIENNQLLRKHINFTGWVSDDELNNLYSNALCLLFPSYYEGFGFPPLEAMAIGTPCIVSNIACIPEICSDAALYFNPFDVESIKMSMQQISEDSILRKNLIERGYDNIKKFNWNESIQNHINIFEKILVK